MQVRYIRVLSTFLGVSAFFGVSNLVAGTIGPTCNTCFGSIYTLNGYLESPPTTDETWVISLSVDTSNYDGADSDYIADVALKLSNKVKSASLLSAPTIAKWTLASVNTNINSSGCSGSGNGWICAHDSANGSAKADGSTYSWVFRVTMAAGSLLDLASIQVNYDPPTGKLMSEKLNVPEGVVAELPLFLAGLGISLWSGNRWRRRKAA